MGTVGEGVSDDGVEKDIRGFGPKEKRARVKRKVGGTRDEIRPVGFTLCLLGRG